MTLWERVKKDCFHYTVNNNNKKVNGTIYQQSVSTRRTFNFLIKYLQT